MNLVINQIVDNLEQAIAEAIDRRDAEISDIRTRYDGEIAKLRQSLASLRGDGEVNGEAKNGFDYDRPDTTSLSVGDDKIEAVLTYLGRHHRARQADIAKALKLNSGSVSVALRRLEMDGVVEPGHKENGSRIWERIRVPADM